MPFATQLEIHRATLGFNSLKTTQAPIQRILQLRKPLTINLNIPNVETFKSGNNPPPVEAPIG